MRFISSVKYFHSFVHDFWKDYSETNPLEKFKLSGNASNNNMTGWTSSCLDSYRNLSIHLQYFHEYVITRVKIVILTSDIGRRKVSTWHHKRDEYRDIKTDRISYTLKLHYLTFDKFQL